MIITSYVCEQCKSAFQRRGRRGYRFCSPLCANQRSPRPTVERLKAYAEKGVRCKSACSELGVTRRKFRNELKAAGLYRLWAVRRYKKCAEAA